MIYPEFVYKKKTYNTKSQVIWGNVLNMQIMSWSCCRHTNIDNKK